MKHPMNNPGIFAAVLLFLLMVSFSSADLTIEVSSEKNSIFPWEEAFYTIKVTNNGEDADKLKYIFPDETEWSLISDPIYILRNIDPGETVETKIRLKPFNPGKASFKEHELSFRIKSEITGRTYSGTFNVFVRNPDMVLDYVPIINIDVDAPTSIDPREDAIVSVRIDNKNRLNITDFSIRIESTVNKENNKEITFPVSPLGSEKKYILLSYDDLQVPTTDSVRVYMSIPSKNESYSIIKKEISILPYSNVMHTTETESAFLKTTTTVTFNNIGNVRATEPYIMQTTLFRQLFTSAVPEPETIKEAGYRVLRWEPEIASMGTEEIRVTVNYRTIFIVILLMILALISYYLLRSPITIKKQAKGILHDTEGGVSKVKIILHIKNRTGKVVDNITIVDKIPHIASLEKEFAIGTLHPTKTIRHEKKGTIVKWQITTLEPFEERIISYQIKSKLDIIGSMKLSRAMVKYKNKRGSFSRAYSNVEFTK